MGQYEKVDVKEVFAFVLSMRTSDKNMETLRAGGFDVWDDLTLLENLVLAVIQQAIEGDAKAREATFRAAGMYDAAHDDGGADDGQLEVTIYSKHSKEGGC